MVFSSSVARVAGAEVAAGLGAVAAAGVVFTGVMAFLAGVAAGAVAGVGAAAGAAAGGVCARASAGKRINSKRILLYTSDAADEEDSVDLGGRRIIKKKK